MPSGDERPAVVDANLEGAAVLQIGDLYQARQWESLVRAAQVPWLHFLTQRSVAPLQSEETRLIIPGASARFAKTERLIDAHGMIRLPLYRIGSRHVSGISAGTRGA